MPERFNNARKLSLKSAIARNGTAMPYPFQPIFESGSMLAGKNELRQG